jgi:Flp pilus assembly protein CpaB
MRFRSAGGLDLATGALIGGGALLIAASIVAAVLVIAPPVSGVPSPEPVPLSGGPGRLSASANLPSDRVAAVLTLDVGSGAGGAARTGDRVDVLGYFSRQITGAEAVTRVLVQDVPVLNIDRSGASVALTLAVPEQSAVLLQEAQALGARPFVTLRPAQYTAQLPSSFSDADLATRFTERH